MKRSLIHVPLTVAMVLFCTACSFSQKYLTGEIAGTYAAGEYFITGNIHVRPNTTLSFEAGSILRFENYTGIVVRGKLVCKGTQLQPVIFTSERDASRGQRAKPEAFDWNGIKVTAEAASTILENCTIAYSTFGLNIESEATPVSLINVTFHDNGQASLTRERKTVPVEEKTPVFLQWPSPQTSSSPSLPLGPTTAPEPAPSLEPTVNQEPAQPISEPATWKKPVRLISIGTAAGGAVLGVIGTIMYLSGRKAYDDPNTATSDLPEYRSKYQTGQTLEIIGFGLLGLGAAGFVITLVF